MGKTVKDVNATIRSIEACINYIERYTPDFNEHDVDYQRTAVKHLSAYITMLENLEVKA